MINYLINNKIGENKKRNNMSHTYRNYPCNINLSELDKPYKFTKDFSFNTKNYRKNKKHIHSQIRSKVKINLKHMDDYDNFIPNKTIYI